MSRTRALGIDPGFATMGLAVLERRDGPGAQIEVLAARAWATKKLPAKEVRNARVSSDDVRRLREFYDVLDDWLVMYEPNVAGIEVYAPFRKQGGTAWKASYGYALAHAVCWARGVETMPFLPADIKRAFALQQSASKTAIERALYQKVQGLEPLIERTTKTRREHVSDACGHAYLALTEVYRLRSMTVRT